MCYHANVSVSWLAAAAVCCGLNSGGVVERCVDCCCVKHSFTDCCVVLVWVWVCACVSLLAHNTVLLFFTPILRVSFVSVVLYT